LPLPNFSLSAVNTNRHITTVIHRRSNHLVQERLVASDRAPLTPKRVVHCLPFSGVRGPLLEFESFDETYLDRLREGDTGTHAHFCVYFGRLIEIKLRSRLASRDDLEDVRQETFKRFFVALRAGTIHHPERLGSFVNSICNNVLKEHYRRGEDNQPSVDDSEKIAQIPSQAEDPLTGLNAKEVQHIVREVLSELSERDRRILREIFLEEREKDDVCNDFGVTREHLRLLVHRAKKAFRKNYEERCA
jgi:RNA polymerase sigma-70 factor, ECF subfamily